MDTKVGASKDDKCADARGGMFGLGEPNDAFAQYFIGQSYLNILTREGVFTANVTFEPGCRNNWHIHHAETGGGQILLCTSGRGWYQAWGEKARELHPGDVVYIPGESALKTYRVIGYDAKRRMACITDMDGTHVHEVPPSALSRW